VALPKKKVPEVETFQAVFENGVLRPLRPLRIREKSRVTVTLCSETEWRSQFDRLLRKMRARTKTVGQRELETEVSQARAEAKAKRRGVRRSA
jgi:predicted DNA-binding antitoxin AbrB/MazE fold protein